MHLHLVDNSGITHEIEQFFNHFWTNWIKWSHVRVLRKPLRSARCLCGITTIRVPRTTAAPSPACGPPCWVQTSGAASPGVPVLSREVWGKITSSRWRITFHRAFLPGVSMSSISSESDYAIPPDACSLDSDYSEPEHKVQRTSSYSCESTGPVSIDGGKKT